MPISKKDNFIISALKFLAYLFPLLASSFYVFGVMYYRGYLTTFGLSEEMFHMTVEGAMTYGFLFVSHVGFIFYSLPAFITAIVLLIFALILFFYEHKIDDAIKKYALKYFQVNEEQRNNYGDCLLSAIYYVLLPVFLGTIIIFSINEAKDFGSKEANKVLKKVANFSEVEKKERLKEIIIKLPGSESSQKTSGAILAHSDQFTALLINDVVQVMPNDSIVSITSKKILKTQEKPKK